MSSIPTRYTCVHSYAKLRFSIFRYRFDTYRSPGAHRRRSLKPVLLDCAADRQCVTEQFALQVIRCGPVRRDRAYSAIHQGWRSDSRGGGEGG